MSLKFGVSLPVVSHIGRQPWEKTAGVDAIVAAAKAADDLGFDYVSCVDHIAVPVSSRPMMGTNHWDPLPALAYVAAVTKRVRLLTHILVVPYRHPIVVAKSYAILDILSKGRLVLGVGVGHMRGEFEVLGVPYEARGPITDEYLQVIRDCWTKKEVAFQGKYVSFPPSIVSPKPVQKPHPPIWVGGNSKRAVRRAVDLGDGWVPWSVSPAEVKSRLVASGKQPGPGFSVVVSMGAGMPSDSTSDPKGLGDAGEGSEEIAGVKRYYVERTTANVQAPPLTISEMIGISERYQDSGATHVGIGFKSESLDDLLHRMAEFSQKVMPRFA